MGVNSFQAGRCNVRIILVDDLSIEIVRFSYVQYLPIRFAITLDDYQQQDRNVR